MKIAVQCTLTVEIEVDPSDSLAYMIEDHDCPGTGLVGEAIMAAIEKHDKAGTCWACALQGQNKIL